MTTNLCNTCKHHHLSLSGNHWCAHPVNGIDPIDGSVTNRLCCMARSNLNGVCGPTGDLHEPIEVVPTPAIECVYQSWYIRLWNWVRRAF